MASFLEGGVVGLAVGEAGGAIVEPALEPTRQEAEKAVHARILEMRELAELVATTLHTIADVREDALRNGFDEDSLRSAVQLALEAPPYSEVLDLWRRNATRPASEQISEAQVDHALGKAKIEYQFWPALKELVNARLSQQVIATAIQRGVMKAPFELPYNADVPVGKITPFPVSPLNTKAEAASSGVDLERLRVETALIGLPMALDRAARATFRKIITEDDFLRAVLEGNARGEWAGAELEVAREILSVTQYAESFLRGYTPDQETMFANMAKHGMSREDANLLFLNQGRPLAIHQVTTGLARGGVYDGPTDHIPAVFLDAVRESNIKPPYYDLDYANRYTYPTGFMIKAEAVAGTLAAADTSELLLELGWSPKWAGFFSDKWAAKADSLVSAARTAAGTATRKAYVGGAISEIQARIDLSALDASTAAQDKIIQYWNVEAALPQQEADTSGAGPH
jgi:hypothetical protein